MVTQLNDWRSGLISADRQLSREAFEAAVLQAASGFAAAGASAKASAWPFSCAKTSRS